MSGWAQRDAEQREDAAAQADGRCARVVRLESCLQQIIASQQTRTMIGNCCRVCGRMWRHHAPGCWVGAAVAVLDLYRARYLDPERPAPLVGKDARNRFLCAQRDATLRALDGEYHALREYLHRHPQARWIFD